MFQNLHIKGKCSPLITYIIQILNQSEVIASFIIILKAFFNIKLIILRFLQVLSIIYLYTTQTLKKAQMFPNNYTFNPGMVLDPVTMTPMLSNGGNITVNPLGVPMRPQNKVWQKMFINNIPQECTNQLMIKFLNQFGVVKNFKRMNDNRGRLMPFCHFQLQTGEQIMRIKRLFSGYKLLNNTLQIKISAQTQNFIKEWSTIQKDQWRKKLLAPGMNEAKQYESLQQFLMRQDKRYKQRIQQTLYKVNNEVQKLARQKRRQEQRKQHPRQKQRQKKQRKLIQQLQRSFNQKQQYWLKRERERQREYRRQKQKQRQKQKNKLRKLEKQMTLDTQEVERRIEKYLSSSDRRKIVEKQEQEDIQILLEENPPLPEEQALQEEKKKRIIAVEEQIKLGAAKIIDNEVLMTIPQKNQKSQTKQKEIKKNQIFDGWDKIVQIQQQKPRLQLNLPDLTQQEQQKQEQAKMKVKIQVIQKQVPQNKQDLWQFAINWEKLAKSVVLQKNIRPWLQQMSLFYIGGVQQKFIALVQKKLFSQSHPDKIIKILKGLLDDDAQQFVVKLWKKLVFQYLKLQSNLT